jgi:hypothetical protein
VIRRPPSNACSATPAQTPEPDHCSLRSCCQPCSAPELLLPVTAVLRCSACNPCSLVVLLHQQALHQPPHSPAPLTSCSAASSSACQVAASFENTAGSSGPSAVRAAPVRVAASMTTSGGGVLLQASARASHRMRRPSASVLPFCSSSSSSSSRRGGGVAGGGHHSGVDGDLYGKIIMQCH